MNRTSIINLENFRTPGSRVFTGRDRGIKVRNDSMIDKVEEENEAVVIKIPEDIGSINPSFLEEFLLNVVVKLKPAKFYQKFKFENKGRYQIEDDLQEAVERILREDTALID